MTVPSGDPQHLESGVLPQGLICVLYGSPDVPQIVIDFARTAPAVVIDNSGDLRGTADGLTVLRPGRNLGYSEGVNAGLAALPPDCRAVLVVNPDIAGPVEALHELAEKVARSPQPMLAAPTGGNGTFGFLPRATAPLVMVQYLLRSNWHPTARDPERQFLSGALLALNAAALKVLAPADELLRSDLFFMDDVDLTDRARANEVQLLEVPVTAQLVHEGGTSMRRRPAVRIYFSRVSKVRYWRSRSPVWGGVLRWFFLAEAAVGEVVARRRDGGAPDGSAAMGFGLTRQWLRTGAMALDERVLGNPSSAPCDRPSWVPG